MLTAMGVVIVFTATQLALVYTFSDYAGTSPAQISAQEFVKSQEGMALYSFLNQRMVFFEQGALFLAVAILLYIFIFFLISVMDDLGAQTGVYYVDGSSSLQTEARRLKIVLSFFGGSYLVRSAFDLIIAVYMTDYLQFTQEYPGFCELAQCAYFFVSDIMPISAFFHMHHKHYGEQNRQQVIIRVDPDHPHYDRNRTLSSLHLDVISSTERSSLE
mmetsp:Transcript_20551/g.27759  ORF Transcript_20551/g.27759 Transcript_20551/m.27759 type:complete len:216 (-) Transcript_20551:214-861(-)